MSIVCQEMLSFAKLQTNVVYLQFCYTKNLIATYIELPDVTATYTIP